MSREPDDARFSPSRPRGPGGSSGDSPAGGPTPVMLVIRHMDVGGAQRQLVNLALGLDRERFRPLVVSLHREQPLMEHLRERGVEAVCLPARGSVDPALPFRLAALARRRKVRIVHSFLFAANAWGRMAGALARVPVVIASERTDRPRRRRREVWTERALAPWTSAYTVNSLAVGRRVASWVPTVRDRIVCIYNGVALAGFDLDRPRARASLRRQLQLSEETPLAGVLGSLTPDKGHRFLLDAMRNAGPVGAALHLAIIGDGPEREALRAEVEGRSLGRQVHFVGERDDVPHVLAGLDLLVQASIREGMPNAVLEGMAAGLPVVATRVGGTDEALDGGRCGRLVEPGSPTALAQGIRDVLADPEGARELAARGALQVRERFSLPAMIHRTQDLYRFLAAGGRLPAPGWSCLPPA